MALRFAIDSNRYTDLCRGVAEVVHVVSRAAEVYVPLIVLGELRAGFAHGNQREKNEGVLSSFLKKPGVKVLLPDPATTEVYAQLYSFLRGKGRPIPTNDLWIASLAVQHSLPLFDRDSDFDNLPQVGRVRVEDG